MSISVYGLKIYIIKNWYWMFHSDLWTGDAFIGMLRIAWQEPYALDYLTP